MPYTPDTWANNDPTKPLNAARLTKLAGQYPQVMADLPAKIADSGDPIGAALNVTIGSLSGAIILPRSTGGDDAAMLNAVLATGSALGLVRFIARPGEEYLLGSPLVLRSNTELCARGASFDKIATSSVNISGVGARSDYTLLTTQNSRTGRSVQDVVVTSGSATITSATAAFTAGDEGKPVRIYEAGHADTTDREPLDTVIASVTNGTTAVLADAAQASATARPMHIGTRDSNIKVTGGRWGVPVMTIGSSPEAWMWQHVFLFRHTDHVTLEEIQKHTLSGKYAVNFGEGMHLTVRDYVGDCDSDGVHITGPARHIDIRNVTGRFGDDITAFCLGENAYGNGIGDTQGDIYDVRIDHVNGSWDGACFKIAGSSYGYKASRFRVSALGQNRKIATQACAQVSNDTGAAVTDDLHFDGIDGTFNIIGGTHGRIVARNIANDSPLSPGVGVFSGASIRELVIENLSRAPGGGDYSAIHVYGTGTTISTLRASGGRWPVNNNFILVADTSSIGRVFLESIEHLSTGVGALVNARTSALVGEVFADNCKSGSTYAFDINNGTTKLHVTGGSFKSLVAAGAIASALSGAVVVEVYGAPGECTTVANAKGTGAVIRSYAQSWRTDISTITADTIGLMATNRNSSLSCGLGPVFNMHASGKWVNLATGTTYVPGGAPYLTGMTGIASQSLATGSTDGSGSITATTGSGATTGDAVRINFVVSWPSAPKAVLVTPLNAAAVDAGIYVSAINAGNVMFACRNVPSGTLQFAYAVLP